MSDNANKKFKLKRDLKSNKVSDEGIIVNDGMYYDYMSIDKMDRIEKRLAALEARTKEIIYTLGQVVQLITKNPY